MALKENFPTVDVTKLIGLYQQRKNAQLMDELHKILNVVEHRQFTNIGREDQQKIDRLVSVFLFVFAQPDFFIPNEHVVKLIQRNHLFANLLQLSSYKTSDAVIETIANHEYNLFKILFLWTVYNKLSLDPDILFKTNKPLASIWWMNYLSPLPGTTSEFLYNAARETLANLPDLELPNCQTGPVYFQSTYFAQTERPIKEKLNSEVARQLADFRITNTPNPKSIAILTGRWRPGTSVYKTGYQQIKALSSKYDLTLVAWGGIEGDTSIFKQIRKINAPSLETVNVSSIIKNDFALAFFMDIGMDYESVCLANIRIAPKMVAGLGHSASTFGSKVDYFISGKESEDVSLARQNYSERLVLIPGTGLTSILPTYELKHPEKSTDKIIVNCPWTVFKINWPLLQVLKRIKEGCGKPIVFRFYPAGTVGRYNNVIPFIRNVSESLGDSFFTYMNLKYVDYLEKMEEAHFSLDSWPFGGYNTIVDSLHVNLPTLTLEGTRFFSKSCAALLRQVGLDEWLICKTPEEYSDKAIQLIQDPHRLENLISQIKTINLQEKIIDKQETDGFVKAIDTILAIQDNSTEPIII